MTSVIPKTFILINIINTLKMYNSIVKYNKQSTNSIFIISTYLFVISNVLFEHIIFYESYIQIPSGIYCQQTNIESDKNEYWYIIIFCERK